MISVNYTKAFVEVLELLKLLPKKEYSKIPQKKIDYLEKNKAKDYVFHLDDSEELTNQRISKEANSIILVLFNEYFATEKEKEDLKKVLKYNENVHQEELRKIYNPDDIFKPKNKNE